MLHKRKRCFAFFFKGLGVSAARSITRLSCFGPYGGIKRNASLIQEASDYAWQVGIETVPFLIFYVRIRYQISQVI